MKKKIILVGTTPPPNGGVTIHIKRLINELRKTEIVFEFYNLRVRGRKGTIDIVQYFKTFKKIKEKNLIIHYQLNNWKELCLIVIFSKSNTIVTTIHSFRIELFSIVDRICYIFCRKKIFFIAPSLTIQKKLIYYKVSEDHISIIDTFFPPNEDELNNPIPKEISSFISMHSAKKIVLASAWKLYKDKLNVDVYGLDMCIQACIDIPNLALVFCVPIISDMNYFNSMVTLICSKPGLSDRILIYREETFLAPLYKKFDLFVRPTSTDSFGISVAEAICSNVYSIASDVCKRYPGCIEFRARDQRDFNDKIRVVINSPASLKDKSLKNNSNIESYVSFYKKHG